MNKLLVSVHRLSITYLLATAKMILKSNNCKGLQLLKKLSLIVFGITFFVLCGCSGYFDQERFETVSIDDRRLERVEAIDLESMVETAPADANDVVEPAELNFTIEQCRALALEHNLDMKVQLFDPMIAEQYVQEAGAVFEPLVFSNFNFIKTDTPTSLTLEASNQEIYTANAGVNVPFRSGGNITINTPFNRTKTDNIFSTLDTAYSSDLSVSVNQPLLRGGGVKTNTHAIRIARYNWQKSRARTKLEIARVLTSVDQAYWRLYAYRRELEVRRQEYDLAMAQWQQAKRRVDAGKVPPIDALRAENATAQRLEAIIKAESNLRNCQRNLKRIINKPDLAVEGKTVIIPQTLPNPRHYVLDDAKLVEFAIAERMDLLELELQLAIDSSTISYEQNAMLPLLSLGYTYNINGLGDSVGGTYDLMFRNRFVDHRLGLDLRVPLGNKAAKSRLQRAILTRRRNLASKHQKQELIKQEVLNAADYLEACWQRVVASGKSATLAKRTLQAEQRQYELGLQTSTEVLDAQTSFADAMSAQIRAIVEYQLAQVELAFSTGTLLAAAQIHIEEQ